LLAAAEGRNSKTDWGWIEPVMKRSTDGGQTWSQAQVIAKWEGPPVANPNGDSLRKHGNTDPGSEGKTTFNNPTLIPDADGRVHLIYFIEYFRAFYRVSQDDGLTWSEPVDITDSAFEPLRKEYPWRVIATGPGTGIQLSQGPHKGRLLAPVWMASGDGTGKVPSDDHRPSVTATIYSDDGGRTWLPGAINSRPTTSPLDIHNPNENILVELSDGRVMANIRSESKAHRRLITISPDGISNWSAPKWDEELYEPVCHASLINMANVPGQPPTLLFTNPDSRHKPEEIWPSIRFCARENLTIRASFDDGKTWPIARAIEPGGSGYSGLAVAPDGTIFCAFEHTDHFFKEFDGVDVSIVAFNLAWMRGE
jgi:sialidase-1